MKRYLVLLLISIVLCHMILPYASAACIIRTTTPTTAPPGPYGTIYVESSPAKAVIYINGENKGHSPVTVTGLWPGIYSINARLAGYQEFSTTATISGATRAPVYISMIPDNTGNGFYIMSTPAKARVYFDDTFKGETPLMLGDPSAGSHSIQLRLSGYSDWKSKVVTPSSGTKVVSAVLTEMDPGLNRGINLSSNPPGAKVVLNGAAKGVTPVSLTNIAAGIHVVELEYPGYLAWKSTIDVPEDEIKEVSIKLTPKPESMPGWISVSTVPENASVMLDGNYAGRTPANSNLNLDSITPGEHSVVVSLSGYKSYSVQVQVSPNLVSYVNTTLIPVSGSQAKGILSIRSEPAGADIFIDNKSFGTTPMTVEDISGGSHIVTIRQEGYDEYSTSILVSQGSTRTVNATLIPVTTTTPYTPLFPFSAIIALGIISLLFIHYHVRLRE